MIRREQILQDPTGLIALLVAGQIVAWTLAPALTHTAPPLDVVEGYMWGREWVIATYKHPALPSWALELSRLVTGGSVGWPAYLVSQLFVAVTFIFVFLLGRDLMGAERAAAGTLLLSGIAFFAWPTPEFNHNIAETPFWAALPFVLWRAVETRRFVWWMLVGAIGAGGLYAKLSTALLLITLAGWILADARARQCLATLGPWLGLGAFLALAAPLAAWLVSNDFILLKYAAERSARMPGQGIHLFLLSVTLNLVGVLIIMAMAGLIGPRPAAGSTSGAPEPPPTPIAPHALAYLVTLTAGPLALVMIGALLTDSNLRSAWGSSMFNLAGILAIALTSARFNARALRRIAVCAAVLVTVLPIGYALAVTTVPPRVHAPLRTSWPQAALSKRMQAVWARETGGQPLRIVSGDKWVAGLVGVSALDRPSILSDGNFALSPWVTPARLEAEGAIVVWDASTRWIPMGVQALIAGRHAREERFQWPRHRARGEIVIRYVIIPPRNGQ